MKRSVCGWLDYEITYSVISSLWCTSKCFSKLELPLSFLNKGSEAKLALEFFSIGLTDHHEVIHEVMSMFSRYLQLNNSSYSIIPAEKGNQEKGRTLVVERKIDLMNQQN